MGAEQSLPDNNDRTTSTSSSQTHDNRTTLERWLDPYNVMSAAPTDPILLQPPAIPASPSASSGAVAAGSSSAHFLLDVSELDDVELSPSAAAEQQDEQRGEQQETEPVDLVDAAMARITPAPLAALLRSPQVSGEMTFAAEAAQRQRGAGTGSSGERRILV